MNTDDLDDALRATLQDGRLSRSERQALSEVLQEATLDSARLSQLRARAFALAKERSTDPRAREALDWVEDLVKLLWQQTAQVAVPAARAFFSPGGSCLAAIVNQLGQARRSADICVFTITDDRIARAILDAHTRGVALRIITDNDKQFDGGSDVGRLRDAGIALRVDETEHHMHHKYAVLDGATLLNGSYNWTRSASEFNEENLIVTNDVGLVRAFSAHFEGLWRRLGG